MVHKWILLRFGELESNADERIYGRGREPTRRGHFSRGDGCKGFVLGECEWVVKTAGEKENGMLRMFLKFMPKKEFV
jgi:hypothetical protein